MANARCPNVKIPDLLRAACSGGGTPYSAHLALKYASLSAMDAIGATKGLNQTENLNEHGAMPTREQKTKLVRECNQCHS